MRVILSKLVFNFDIELCSGCENWIDQESYFLWDKPALMVRLLDVDDIPHEFRNSAAGFKMMSVISDLMSEGRAKGTGAQEFRSSADEARRIESDPAHPLHEAYMDYNHPNHKYANEMYDRYMGLGG